MNPLRKCFVLTALVVVLPHCTASKIDSSPKSETEVGAETGSDDEEPVSDEWDEKLAERVVDYNAALRKAALKLTGDLPSLAEIRSVAEAGSEGDKRAVYAALVQDYMSRPEFSRAMFAWWQDTLKLGDDAEYDQAAAFAAQVTVENRSYLELLTATSGQCGSFDSESAVFSAGECANGVAQHAGLLSHPGAMRQYFGNLAFRRVKWVQETFACTQFPAEKAQPVNVGGASPYTGVWPFESISGLETGRIDFRDTSSVICANCHSTMNHIAPLFAHFDGQGQYSDTMVVPTPLEGSPAAQLSDYLISGEELAWRSGGPATPNLPALGQAMANDPAIAECAIARAWNWALGKGDIVEALREVPSEIIAAQVADFSSNGFRFKDALLAVFTSDDFVRF